MGANAGMGGGVGMERRKPDFVSRRNEPAGLRYNIGQLVKLQ